MALKLAHVDALAVVSRKGSQRWMRGHPWIYRSDVADRPETPPGVVRVVETNGRELGWALWSPRSEISLRLLDPNPSARIDLGWWTARVRDAVNRRASIGDAANAYRLIHGEGDALPSLICDRYDRWLVVQLMSAGLESQRELIVDALRAAVPCEGILARNDVPLRSKEGLRSEVALLWGDVPREIEVLEHGVRYLAAPWDGQKTGAFLDQRENRARIAELARGQSLDCFAYHGSFALHLARRADHVIALDSSLAALERAAANASRNGFSNIEPLQADAFEYLREQERDIKRFDTIVLDPPAFAKTKSALPAALRGYKEANLRCMRLLAPGGILFTASCSFHLSRTHFLEMLADAAGDSGRRLVVRELRGQPIDHPEVLTIPETGYLKGAIIQCVE